MGPWGKRRSLLLSDVTVGRQNLTFPLPAMMKFRIFRDQGSRLRESHLKS